jgi:hypothetical protein
MKKSILLLTLIAMAILSVTTNTNANVWRVNNQTAYNQWANHEVFSSLTAAIGSPNVLPGDTLYIEASGTSYGVINLNKSLTLIGTGYFLQQNGNLQHNATSSTLAQLTFKAGSSGSTVSGLRIADANYASIHFDNVALSNITITRCYVDYGLDFNNAAGIVYSNFVITKNYIQYVIDHTNFAPGTFTGLIFTNNYVGSGISFYGSNFYGVVAQNVTTNLDIQSNIQCYNNIITGNNITQSNNTSSNIYNNVFSAAQPAWLTGGNNSFGVPTTTIFPATGTTDLINDPNPVGICPQCYQGYPGGVEVGMFGGNDPYRASGIPSIPAIYNLQAPANVPAGGTLPVTISTRTNN